MPTAPDRRFVAISRRFERWCRGVDIAWVTGDHGLVAAAGVDDHARVDRIAGASLAAKDTGSFGDGLIKDRNGYVAQLQGSG